MQSFAGVWIGRYNRRTVMIAADGLVAASSAALGIAFWISSAPPVWFIFLILFIRGIGSTFHSPAMQAAIPMFVPADMLTKAGGWGNLITSISTMLGPALGAGMMAVFPIAPIMLVDMIGAVLAIVCLLAISLSDVPGTGARVSLLSDTKQGFLAMKENKPLMAICLLGLAAFCGGILPTNGFPTFVFCCFFMGASGTFFNVPLMAHIQSTVAPQMMGKVFSLLTTAMTLTPPCGLLLAGPVSEAAGVDLWFAGSGLLMTAIGIICYFSTRKYDC